MKKFVVYIGPDTFGFSAKSKDHIKRRIKKALKRKDRGSKVWNEGHLGHTFKGRKYTYTELDTAVIMTLDNFFKSISENYE